MLEQNEDTRACLSPELPYARTQFKEKLTFNSIPHNMTKTEKLQTLFRNTSACIFGNDCCEESSLDCGGMKLRCFGDEWMRTPVKVSRSGKSNTNHKILSLCD